MKRIVICSDGTWNRPEKDLTRDVPTNVLRLARAIQPIGADAAGQAVDQQVFYDWGIGSYDDKVIGGATGRGINKNIMDAYLYIVQNYSPGDEIFLFGFSRGAYTVRSVCGMINNCGVLKRADARLVQAAFDLYKRPGKDHHPEGAASIAFRKAHAHPSRAVKFVGVWDTVGALGIPFSFLGLLERRDEFYDTKIGPNVEYARHALGIDELREDFEPTIWNPRDHLDLKQVWFAGVHSDIGGGYARETDGAVTADIPLNWMIAQARALGLAIETHLTGELKAAHLKNCLGAKIHQSRKHIYRSKQKFYRPVAHGKGEVLIHASVKQRWDANSEYRPKNLQDFLDANGGQWPANLETD